MGAVSHVTRLRASQDPGRDLSVGVEIKFLVPFLPPGQPDPRGLRDPAVREAAFAPGDDNLRLDTYDEIADVISAVPDQQAVSVRQIQASGEPERHFWTTHWIVKKSHSAEPSAFDPAWKAYVWVPVEINTPRLPFHSPSTFAVLRNVLEAVRRRFRLASNYSCEIHVHAGRMDGQSFDLPALKRMATVLWLTEPSMRSVKDPNSPNFHHDYTWSSPLREHSRLALALAGDDELSPCDTKSKPNKPHSIHLVTEILGRTGRNGSDRRAIERIWSARDHETLGKLLSGEDKPYRRLGFNFSPWGMEDERARSNPRTIECRFLEGIIDTTMVLSWVKIYGELLEAALDDERLLRLAMAAALVGEGDIALPPQKVFAGFMDSIAVRPETYEPFVQMIQEMHMEDPRFGTEDTLDIWGSRL